MRRQQAPVATAQKGAAAVQYNIPAIRTLLTKAFTDQDLIRFCQEDPLFNPVLSFFPRNASREQMTRVLIAYCDVRSLFPRLLAAIRKANPRQYAANAPYRYPAGRPVPVPESVQPSWRNDLIDRLEGWSTIIKNPAMWQEAMWTFVAKHRVFLLVIALLEIGLLAVYLPFRNLYLIPWWLFALAAALLLAAAWGWYTWLWHSHTRGRLVVTLFVTLAFAGLAGSQLWRAAFPERFAPQTFGVALAELAEGAGSERTARTREITDQVYEHLCRTLKENLASDQDPCGTRPEGAEQRPVELQRIGVIPDSQRAQTVGKRIGADVVIWGHVLAGNGNTSIRFQMLETPDRAVNPEFPIVLPVETTSAEVFARELDLESNPVTLKRVIAQQSTIIASFTLGVVAYLDRDFAQAVNHFEAAKDAVESLPAMEITSEGYSLLYFYLGRANFALGRIEEGDRWHRQAQSLAPTEPAIPLSIALGQRSSGLDQESVVSLDRALSLIQRWLETHPDDPAALYDRGVIHQVRNQYEDALLDYEKVIERDPGFYIGYIGLGQAAFQAGRLEQAIDALQTAIARSQEAGANAAWAHLNLAVVYQGAGEPALAEIEFQAAIALKSETPWMYYYYARFLEGQQEMDAALLAYQNVVDVAPEKGWAYGQLGDFYTRRGLFPEALDGYKKAVHEQPEDGLHWAHLAQTLVRLGAIDEAIPTFEQAIKAAPESYYVYASYGWALLQAHELQRAATMYERALQLQPDEYTSLLNLGQIYEALGQPDRAQALYLHILESSAFSEEQRQVPRERLGALGVESP